MKNLTEILKGVLEGVVLQKIQTGETGTYMYSCWMGMIRGVIILKEA
ncbi:hypothetical protein [Peribacillus simplex]|nr:hypothetical protein [Peribacillus simplex]